MTAQTHLGGAAQPAAPDAPPDTEETQWAAYEKSRRPALRRRARRDLARFVTEAAIVLCAGGLLSAGLGALDRADAQVFALGGIAAIFALLGAFVAWAMRPRRAPDTPPPMPYAGGDEADWWARWWAAHGGSSSCICGQTPTVRRLGNGWWWIGCAPPCDAALCAMGKSEDEARQRWECVVSEARGMTEAG